MEKVSSKSLKIVEEKVLIHEKMMDLDKDLLIDKFKER